MIKDSQMMVMLSALASIPYMLRCMFLLVCSSVYKVNHHRATYELATVLDTLAYLLWRAPRVEWWPSKC
jgi:hypothetical protein